MSERDPRALYDADAELWRRRSPESLSDFTGRPAVFEMWGEVAGLRTVDLGCGEGYCTRELARRGAKSVLGVELSDEMVGRAQAAEAELQQGITYQQGDVRSLDLPDESFDLVTAVFVFNYLDLEGTRQGLAEMRRILVPGGRLVFAVPHPAFAFIHDRQPPFWFDTAGADYFSARDQRCEGEIHCRDGRALRVQMVHKTLEDFFAALAAAGFTTMPEVRELRVLPEHLELDPGFFGPVAGVPLHMGFGVTR